MKVVLLFVLFFPVVYRCRPTDVRRDPVPPPPLPPYLPPTSAAPPIPSSSLPPSFPLFLIVRLSASAARPVSRLIVAATVATAATTIALLPLLLLLLLSPRGFYSCCHCERTQQSEMVLCDTLVSYLETTFMKETPKVSGTKEKINEQKSCRTISYTKVQITTYVRPFNRACGIWRSSSAATYCAA